MLGGWKAKFKILIHNLTNTSILHHQASELLKMKATQTLAVLQRLLRQSAENAGQAWQGKLLVFAP